MLAFGLLGCSAETESTPLPFSKQPGEVANCAGQSFSVHQVREVARLQKITPAEAVKVLAEDARLAAEAKLNNAENTWQFRAKYRALLARRLLERWKQEAKKGEITPEELEQIRKQHWLQVDRPSSLRVIHAVSLVDPKEKGDKRERAESLARSWLKAAEKATTAEEFERTVKGVDAKGASFKVERLEPFARDGRIVAESGGKFDHAFADCAFAIKEGERLSAPCSTSFGVHVIFLMERLPGFRESDQKLRKLALEEILANRARTRETQEQQRLRGQHAVVVIRSLDETMAPLYRARAHP
jgi:hypothetical protein